MRTKKDVAILSCYAVRMPLLHLQCLRDLPEAPRERRGLLAATGLREEDLDVVRPFDAPVAQERLDRADAITIGGSGWSAFEDIPHYEAFADLLKEARRRRIPILGICFGAQTLARHFGGTVVRDEARAEFGTIEVELTRAAANDPLFADLPPRFNAQSWHHDRIVAPPSGAVPLAWSQDGAVLQAFGFPDEPLWGVQFHPERSAELFREIMTQRWESEPERRARLLANLRPSTEAAHLLRRFARLYVTA